MKHTLKITLILVFLFLLAQIIGLVITNHYLPKETLAYGLEKPELREETSFLTIVGFIIIGTIFIFALRRFNLLKLIKWFFFFSVLLTLSISFSAFINEILALILALILTVYKVIKRNVYVHNFTELFIYGALAAIFVPVLNIFSAFMLLILISIYDAYAVWKSKHMIRLAKIVTKLKFFPGFFIPYKKETAILGGGDIGFPLLFTGAVMKSFGFKAYIIPLFVSLSLLLLLLYSKKKKFYPAMPFLSVGCFIGYFVLLIF